MSTAELILAAMLVFASWMAGRGWGRARAYSQEYDRECANYIEIEERLLSAYEELYITRDDMWSVAHAYEKDLRNAHMSLEMVLEELDRLEKPTNGRSTHNKHHRRSEGREAPEVRPHPGQASAPAG